MSTNILNWAGNYTFSTRNLQRPTSVEQVQALVQQSKKLRVLGSRHSFNGIADSADTLMSLEKFNQIVEIDTARHRVTIEAGMRYGELAPALHAAGLALPNLASLPHITVAGATATATHGSGDRNQNLAAAVAGLEIVTANGDVVHFSREDDPGAIVHLGGLGVVTHLTLDLQPNFDIYQEVFVNLPVAELEAHFDEIMAAAYSVSIFTDWQGGYDNQVWLKQRAEDNGAFRPKTEFFGAAAAGRPIHPIAELDPTPCTEQMGLRGGWHERLTHFRIEHTPSAGEELQSEYFVAREDAVAALRAVRALAPQLVPALRISELRSIAADDLWMSSVYQRDSIAIHFTWHRDWPAVSKLLPLIEAALAPFNPRPHWGKLFTMPPGQVQARYSRLAAFREMLRHYDPEGKFRNTFLETNIF